MWFHIFLFGVFLYKNSPGNGSSGVCAQSSSLCSVYTLWAPQTIILFRVRESLGCLASEVFSLKVAANSTEEKKVADERSPVGKRSQWFLFKILVWKQRAKPARLQSVYIPKSLQRETASSCVAPNTLLFSFSVLLLAFPQKTQSLALHACSPFSPLKNCPCWVITFKSVNKDLSAET